MNDTTQHQMSSAIDCFDQHRFGWSTRTCGPKSGKFFVSGFKHIFPTCGLPFYRTRQSARGFLTVENELGSVRRSQLLTPIQDTTCHCSHTTTCQTIEPFVVYHSQLITNGVTHSSSQVLSHAVVHGRVTSTTSLRMETNTVHERLNIMQQHQVPSKTTRRLWSTNKCRRVWRSCHPTRG